MNTSSQNLRVTKSHWTGSCGEHKYTLEEGRNLEQIVVDFLYRLQQDGVYTERQAKKALRLCKVYVDGIPVSRKNWLTSYPKPNSHIHIYQAVHGGGGGGGGGKNLIVGALLVVAAVVISVLSWGTLTAPAFSAAGSIMAGLAATAVSTMMTVGIGLMLSGAMSLLFPTPTPKMPNFSSSSVDEGSSRTYSVNGQQNTASPRGQIPILFGKHKMTPPLAARSWTSWEGNQNYFHMMVLWGQPDLTVGDIFIGETPISNYSDVEHILHQSSYGDDLKLFSKTYYETSIGAELTHANGWVTRTVGEAEDLSIDVQFNGLFAVDQNSGATIARTVCFQIQYKLVSEIDWRSNFLYEPFSIAPTSLSGVWSPLTVNRYWDTKEQEYVNTYTDETKVFVNSSGQITAGKNISGQYMLYPTKNRYISGCSVSMTRSGNYVGITISSGSFAHDGSFCYTNSNRDLYTGSIRKNNLPRDTYEVRIRRTTGDSNSQYIYDTSSWTTARAILNVPAFTTPVPWCVSELRIKASEQMNGYVNTLNATPQCKCLDWDKDTQTWIYRETKNPASHIRYALTSPHCLILPFKDSRLDMQSFQDFHEFCEEKGYEFNYIADDKESLWDRLNAIASVGRGSPTIENGKWAIIIDKGDKPVKQLFTPANSWGMSVNRVFPKIPDAMRVTFINEENDYLDDAQYVYNDGYNRDGSDGKKRAVDIIEWSYDGITKWDLLYKHARRHMAGTLHRPFTVTINTDWEWLAIRRGDLCGISSLVLLNTFGQGYITCLIYKNPDNQELIYRIEGQDIPKDEDDVELLPIGLQLHDYVQFSQPEPARYGLAIRTINGVEYKYELIPQYGEAALDLFFKDPIHSDNAPKIGELASVGFLGQEYEEYLLAAVTPNERLTAELVLIPYAINEIDAAESGLIPPFEPVVIPGSIGSSKKLPTPIIIGVKSDEDVLTATSSGTIPTVKVWTKILSTNFDASKFIYQLHAFDKETNEFKTGNSDRGVSDVSIQGVVEKRLYTLKVRIIDYDSGLTSDWSSAVDHVIIGRTTNPPAPNAVYLDGNIMTIEQQNRPLDLVGHVITVCMDAEDTIEMGKVVTNPYATDGKFDLTPYAGRARKVYVQAIDEIGLLSDPVFVLIQLGDIIPDNVLFEFSEQEKHWPGILTGGEIIDEDAYAYVTSSRYEQNNNVEMYPQNSLDSFYPQTTGTMMRYTYEIKLLSAYLGATLKVFAKLFSGHITSIEYRLTKDEARYPQRNELVMYQQENMNYFYPQGLLSEWQLLPSAYTITDEGTIEIRVTTNASSQAIIDDIITVIDVEDKTLHISNVTILADGTTRIAVPPNYFRGITNVQITQQYIEDSTAVSSEYVPNSELFDGDYVSQGQYIRALDANKTMTSANVDLFILGY